jgi:autotransporter-associated beta strand protein
LIVPIELRRNRANDDRPPDRTPVASLFGIVLIMAGAAGSAFAQTCDNLCPQQNADQQALLAPFSQLLNTPAGLAALQANLQTEETIYLNSTPAQKNTAAENALLAYVNQNILIGTFPANPYFYYTQAGVPTAVNLPASIANMLSIVTANVTSNPQLDLKDFFGAADIYGIAYNATTADPNGDPRPFQVSSAIASNPFTQANSSQFANQVQQTNAAYSQTWSSYTKSPAFPSGHSFYGNTTALLYAILAPGYYQQFVQEGVDFAYSRNVFGVHYPLDVIGGRILAEYMTAQTLSDNPLYSSANLAGSLGSLSQTMQAYLASTGVAGGGASLYAAPCAGRVAACIAGETIPSAAAYAQQIQNYTWFLTYNLPPVGDTTLAPVVPANAYLLIATRFPYLSTAQLNQVLATTELPSGGALDNGTGWARLNLCAAASGYGAFAGNVTVSMNAASGGLNAFDIWSNDISGPGGLTLQGSGTLILVGNNTFTGGTTVQGGTLGFSGALAGNVTVWPGAAFAGSGSIGGSLAMLPGSTLQAAIGANGSGLIRAAGTATLSGATLAVGSFGNPPPLGTAWPILTATGGISGSFASLAEPANGLAAGTRFDTIYAANTVTVAVTPSLYGGLAAAGVAESRSESTVGSVLDAFRPAPGVLPDPAHAALFDPLYGLPAGGITAALDELAPSIYADGLITARNAWYLMADAVGGQLAERRGLAADHGAHSAPGPNGSTIWVTTLAGYDVIGSGGGSPGFTAGLGGAAAGIDIPIAGSGRIGAAIGTVDGQTWPQAGGHSTTTSAQAAAYGQWRSGAVFAEAQLGVMYEQETARRPLALFGASARGDTNATAAGGGLRFGVQQHLGAWLIEPSLGFGGFDLYQQSLMENQGGALAEGIGGATLGSAESTLAVSAQRGVALSRAVWMTVKGQVGWSHEFADNAASVQAGFAGLSGSGFVLNSAPIGRDAAVVGLDADFAVAAWPVSLFAGYGGAISGSSDAHAFNAGMRLIW